MRNVYDAVGIEHTLARFFGGTLGARGEKWDADVFRRGEEKQIAEIVEMVADRVEERAARVKWSSAEQENGAPQRVIEAKVSYLRRYAENLRKSGQTIREDPRWEMLGGLVGIIDSLLLKLGV